MSGGTTNIKGGTAHSGSEMSMATMAMTVEPTVHAKLVSVVPPCLSAKCAKRRCTTRSTKPGVIISDTANNEMTTNTGVMAKITTRGTMTACNSAAPLSCNQSIMPCSTCQEASISRTQSWVGDQ